MKLNFFLCYILLLVFTQCSSQNNENKSKKSTTVRTTKDHKNKTWPQYMGPNRNGKVESDFTPLEKPKINWEFEYKGGKPTPLIVDNGTVFFGTETKDIYAIDSIGNLKWKIKLNSKIKHSLLISNGVLVAAPDSTMVYGINASNGNVIWKRDFSYKYKSYISNKKSFFGDPIIDVNKFVIKKKGKNEAAPLMENNNKVFITTYQEIVVLDIKTGKTQYKINKPEGVRSTPLITDDVIYINTEFGYQYALDKLTGSLKWESKISDLNYSYPFIYKDSLYVSSYYFLNKINKKSGKKLGILSFMKSKKKYNIIDNGIYYVTENGYHTRMGVNYGSYVKAYDLISEKKKWDFNITSKYISELIMVGDYIYFGDSSGNVRALNKSTGEKMFGGYIGGSILSPLSYSNGIIYGTSYKEYDNYIIFAIR